MLPPPAAWPGALLVLLSVLPACAPRQAPRPQPPPQVEPERPRISAADRLRAEIDTIVRAPSVSDAHIGVLVRSLDTGETLYALNQHHLLVPASNQKLLTAAAAARRLGWDYRFTTRVLATGPVKPDGTLDGDLVVVGGGDPTINPRHPERWAALDQWAGQIAAHGVKVIGGHLIGDDNAFAEPGLGSGWSWDDLALGYGSPIGALQYHENELEIAVGPGLEPGARAVVTVSPMGGGLLVDNRAVTVAGDQPSRISLERAPGWTTLTVRGEVAVGARPRVTRAAVDSSTELLLSAFREALSRKGVVVAGSAIDIDALPQAPDLSAAETWVTDHSAPVSEIVDALLKWSLNGYSETLLWALSPPGQPASEAAGLSVLRETLTELGVAPELYRAFDGSGLSRYDMVSAEALVALLTAIWRDPGLLGPYRSALPVAGVSGSLDDRMKGSAAEGRVWAKTGSMFNIRSLSGYALSADNEPLVFSFLANNYTVPSREIEQLMDEALIRLASFRRER